MEEKLRDVEKIVDAMSPVEFFTEVVGFFGGERATQLVGWAVLFGVAGIENGPAYRQRLIDRGLSQSAYYRASSDFRRFGKHLEKEHSWRLSGNEVARRLVALDSFS